MFGSQQLSHVTWEAWKDQQLSKTLRASSKSRYVSAKAASKHHALAQIGQIHFVKCGESLKEDTDGDPSWRGSW